MTYEETPLPLEPHLEPAVLDTSSKNHHTVMTDRKEVYPDMSEYVDAKVKQQSDDPAMIADGIRQEAEYVKACLAVKVLHPKGSI